MSRLQRMGEALVLLGAGYASLATSAPVEGRMDERWVIINLFDGQTAVPRDVAIELRIGLQDFRPPDGGGSTAEARARADAALAELSLREADGGASVALAYELGEETTTARPTEPLRVDTRYELDAAIVAGSAVTARPIPEVIEFTTRPGPKVTGLWRVNETLMITFSEPMPEGALELSTRSIDLLWLTSDGLHSIAADRNLAEYVWDDDGLLFRVAPIDTTRPLWVKVSGELRGVSGAPLDGDGDGVPGEAEDDFLEEVVPTELPGCFTSDDRPEPCLPGP